jgi:NAD(P)-dependent dehydrogenase (short-subunit alcohol dehydrogenase family)
MPPYAKSLPHITGAGGNASRVSKLFEGKVAVVTGGNAGIGRAAALAFAAEGARVAIGARRATESAETVSRIEQQGGEALFVATDVTQPDQVDALIQAAVSRWGRLDFAFNNAGIAGPVFIPVPEYPLEAWNEVLAVNLTGVFLAMKFEIPQMLKTGGGAIVNMSSVAGQIGGLLGSAYYASKHGVIGVTKAAAIEYATAGIRVNAVCPAVIGTELSAAAFSTPERAAAVKAMHPMGRFGAPNEVADAVVWLCSDKAAFVTGHALPIDGGLLAR